MSEDRRSSDPALLCELKLTLAEPERERAFPGVEEERDDPPTSTREATNI